jgi:cytochrome P450
MLAFLSYDPPEHTRFRQLVAPLFSPSRMELLSKSTEQEANALIDRMAPLGRCRFGAAFASQLPLIVVSNIFEVGDEFRNRFIQRQKRFAEEVQSGNAGGIGSPEEDISEIIEKFYGELSDQLVALMEERRRAPRNDMLSQLLTRRFVDTNEPPTTAELLPVVKQIFAAGIESSGALLRSGMRVLSTNPGLAEELRQHPELMDGFVEELLRCHGSAKMGFRLTLREVELDGAIIPPRSIVAVVFQAGNRDPAQFPMPHNFDIRRSNARTHLAFGGTGIHTCIGMHIARANFRISFKLLLNRLEDIRLAKDSIPPVNVPSFLGQGPDDVEIEYSAV